MQKLIFDTSAIFNFGKRGELEFLLDRLIAGHHLLITPQVDLEILDPDNRGFYEKLLGKYFSVQQPKDTKIGLEQLQSLAALLGKGEVSVILLASELDATAVLDERLARIEAEKLKIRVTGTLGILANSIKQEWCTDETCIEIVKRLHSNKFRIRRPSTNETFAEYFQSLK